MRGKEELRREGRKFGKKRTDFTDMNVVKREKCRNLG